MFEIKDHRWVIVHDPMEAYSDTDREQWITALGADDLRRVAYSSSGSLLLVHFPKDTVNLLTMNSAFGNGITAIFKGNPMTVSGSEAYSVEVPIYALEYITTNGGPS